MNCQCIFYNLSSPSIIVITKTYFDHFFDLYWSSFHTSCIAAIVATLNVTQLRSIVRQTLQIRHTALFTMSTNTGGPIESAITEALTQHLSPVHLEVINESYMHNVPKGAESHFKVLVVSDKFQDLTLLKRHRLVNEIVKQKLAENFPHALSIEAKTPLQWDANYKVEPSPNCRGGFGK